MSTKQSYLPSADKDRVVWLKNFSAKFTPYATSLGFIAADATAIANDTTMFTYLVDMVELFKSEQGKRVAYKNLVSNGDLSTPVATVPSVPALPAAPAAVPAGIFKRLAKVVQRIKNHPNYNDAIGQDLGIIASPNTIDIETMKPVLKGGLDAGRPLIKWKKGDADSIDIYVNRNDDKGFVFLANDSQPDYIDTLPLPVSGIWEYKAIYKIADEQVGEFSDIIAITVSKQVANIG
jgi:hypothetical protein